MSDHTETSETSTDIHHLVAQRRANRDALREAGLEPYGKAERGLMSLEVVHAGYDAEADADHQAHGKEEGHVDKRPRARVAGRVMLHRDNGKLVWLNLRDASGDVQVAVSKRDCEESGFTAAKLIDLGDVVVAEGPIMKTRAGEVTIWASAVRPASKCLVPPPEKWAGLQDTELRYRQRYVDLWANPETMRVFTLRSKLIARMRRYLDERGFVEVDTPVLQALAGGAAAQPFSTHLNALDIDLFLRIAPELYLKRLLVGGMPKVYEVSRNFRNEGVDRSHNPEFTSVEVYEAFGDSRTMMELTEGLIRDFAIVAAADRAKHSVEDQPHDADDLKLPFGDLVIDYGSPFVVVTYGDLFEKALGFPMSDTARARDEAKSRGLKHEGLDDALVINELFEEVAEATIDPQRPTFVTDYPAAISPLTRPYADRPDVADRWDIFIGGMEIGPAYTELNDPDIQEAKFREQLAGIDDEESTFRTFDDDFVNALRVGMPPAGGLGLGIDRLVMLMAGQESIRDVLLFPFMRPV